MELGAILEGAGVVFSVALLRFFCMPSQADPSRALDGEAWPALVTWGKAPGGRKAVLLLKMEQDPQLLHTPLSSPKERERGQDIDGYMKRRISGGFIVKNSALIVSYLYVCVCVNEADTSG